jgi:hypothetical protein
MGDGIRYICVTCEDDKYKTDVITIIAKNGFQAVDEILESTDGLPSFFNSQKQILDFGK